jgi:Leucine-rich repeat (LRR) protein
LSFGFNKLARLPEDVSSAWPSLVVLDFRDNKLGQIPTCISTIEGLQRLDLTNNDLTTIPPELGHLALHSLLIAGNRIRGAPRAEQGTPALLKWLRDKIVNQTEEDSIGADTTHSMEQATVSGSRDGPISLNLSKRQLACISEGLSENCVDLDLSHNAICSLETSLRHLPLALRLLNLTRNPITALPKNIATYTRCLDTLDMTACRLQGTLDFPILPASLTVLLLADNQLDTLVITSKHPSALKTLDVSNNALRALPLQLAFWADSMTVLKVGGNVFRVPRQAVLQAGTATLMRWLQMQLGESA